MNIAVVFRPREYEVAAENGHRVRVRARSERDAVEQAAEIDSDIWYAGAYPVGGRPVGDDGDDPCGDDA